MKQIIMFALVIFSITLLLSFDYQKALAVEGVHSVTGMTVGTDLKYNGGANTYISYTAASATMEKISPTTFTRTTATLPSTVGSALAFDCSITTDVCVYSNVAGTTIRGVTASGTQLWSITPDSSAVANAGFIDVQESLGIVLVTVVCSANSNRILQIYDLGTGTFIKNVGNCAGTALSNGINTIDGYLQSSTEYALTLSGAGQVGNFQIWNISPTTPTRTCTWATVTTLTGSEGDIIRLGSNYYVSDGTTLQALTTACADTTDITSTSHGMSTIITIYKSTVRSEYYVEDITGFAVMNTSSITQKLGEITCTATSGTNPSTFADEFIQLACLDDTNNIATVIEISAVGTGSETPVEGSSNGQCTNTDTNGDGVAGTALDCVGDRSTINAITGAPAVTGVVNQLGNGLGIFNETNTDIKTNGTGLFLMLITGTFFACAVLATIGIANSKFGAGISYTEIPKEFWLFLVVGTVSIAFFLAWIPDIVFYGMITGIAALFTFGIYMRFGRGG